MNSMKETASNIAASAKAGMEKTKATVEEKVEKMTSRDPVQKQMATEKKEERIRQAELEKQEVRQHNAVAKNTCTDGGYTAAGTGAYTTGATHTYSTTGEYGQPAGAHQMSALPGHGTGQPAGQVVDARTEAHPIGSTTGVAGTKSHNTRVEGNPHGYETGGTYS